MEKAYHQKCVDLKRRLNEIEAVNDAARARKRTLNRAIMKMRLQRAIMLAHLIKSQQSNVDDSDKSSSPPPTPHDRPPRIKRSHRKSSPFHEHQNSVHSPPPPDPHGLSMPNLSYAPPTQHDQRAHFFYPRPGMPQVPLQYHQYVDPNSFHTDDPHYQRVPLPLIHSLPVGTTITARGPNGKQKQPPYILSDLEERHHFNAMFDHLSPQQQEEWVYKHNYLPFDMEGNSVLLHRDPVTKKFWQVHRGHPSWVDPGKGPRTDGAPPTERRTSERDRRVSGERPGEREREREREREAENGTGDAPVQGRESRKESGSGAPPPPPPAVAGGFTAANK